MSTANPDAELVARGERFEKFLLEYMDAWLGAISVPAGETRVLKYFQERMPYGLFVPDVL
jgi:hypothetical protein